jgi:Domain of unknown function (DUF4167)
MYMTVFGLASCIAPAFYSRLGVRHAKWPKHNHETAPAPTPARAHPRGSASGAARPNPSSSQNAQRNYGRYLALARGEFQIGDTIGAENYYQHAEHYFRSMSTQHKLKNRAFGWIVLWSSAFPHQQSHVDTNEPGPAIRSPTVKVYRAAHAFYLELTSENSRRLNF